MRVLLTGGTGLVGGAILRRLLAEGHDVILATSSEAVTAAPAGPSVLRWSLMDADPAAPLRAALEDCDAVVHAAAMIDPPAPGNRQAQMDLYRFNVLGTQALMAGAVDAGVAGFVYISATNLFGPDIPHITETSLPRPSSLYTASKLAGETIATILDGDSRTRFCSLRISAPYGAGYRRRAVLPLFLEKARAGVPLPLMGSGKRRQVFTYTEDIATAVLRCLRINASGIYNIAGSESVTMEYLARTVLKLLPDSESCIEWTGKPDPQEARMISIDISKSKDVLGWSPQFDLESGLSDMIRQEKNTPGTRLLP